MNEKLFDQLSKEYKGLPDKLKGEDEFDNVSLIDDTYEKYRDSYRFFTAAAFAFSVLTVLMLLITFTFNFKRETGQGYITTIDGNLFKIEPSMIAKDPVHSPSVEFTQEMLAPRNTK